MLKRLVKTPKLYIYDTGLVCYLTKWSSAETLESGAIDREMNLTVNVGNCLLYANHVETVNNNALFDER